MIAPFFGNVVFAQLSPTFFPRPKYYIGAKWMPSAVGQQDYDWRFPPHPDIVYSPADQNWAPGQPRLKPNGQPRGRCVYVRLNQGWFNGRCNIRKPAICFYYGN